VDGQRNRPLTDDGTGMRLGKTWGRAWVELNHPAMATRQAQLCVGGDTTSARQRCCSPQEEKYDLSERLGGDLAAEAIEGASLALEGVDDIHGGDGLPASVLGVGDSVADDVLEEDLEHGAGLLVDEARDTLHTTTASETADSGLGDSLDVVTENLPVALGAALAETLATLSTSGHCD
jgi:hypothetical protein